VAFVGRFGLEAVDQPGAEFFEGVAVFFGQDVDLAGEVVAAGV
jgi:hypothetical protein